jgi:hypothetical protein
MSLAIDIDREKIAEFCRKRQIRRLALFGSVLRDDFRPDSDVDVLVEFEEGHVPGLIRLGAMAQELSEILSAAKVDLRTAEDLSELFRDEVMAQAQVQYARP